MTTTVTVTYADCEPTTGELYLPREPALFDDFSSDCALCGELLATEPDYATGRRWRTNPAAGAHSGIVDLPQSAEVGEQVHLRCLVDTAEQGECEVTIGKIPTRPVGRHGAS
jgi:hypothetical protein